MITFVSLNDKFFNIYVHKNKSKKKRTPASCHLSLFEHIFKIPFSLSHG